MSNEDLNFFCLNANDESIQIFLEVIFNLITNENISKRVKDKDLFESVRAKMKNNQKKWKATINSRNNKSKVNFIRRQIGTGILDDICDLIIPIIISLL